MAIRVRRIGVFFVLAAIGACHPVAHATPAPAEPESRIAPAIAPAESMYAELRAVKDRIGVTAARGAAADFDGQTLEQMHARYQATRAAVDSALTAVDSATLPEDCLLYTSDAADDLLCVDL